MCFWLVFYPLRLAILFALEFLLAFSLPMQVSVFDFFGCLNVFLKCIFFAQEILFCHLIVFRAVTFLFTGRGKNFGHRRTLKHISNHYAHQTSTKVGTPHSCQPCESLRVAFTYLKGDKWGTRGTAQSDICQPTVASNVCLHCSTHEPSIHSTLRA